MPTERSYENYPESGILSRWPVVNRLLNRENLKLCFENKSLPRWFLNKNRNRSREFPCWRFFFFFLCPMLAQQQMRLRSTSSTPAQYLKIPFFRYHSKFAFLLHERLKSQWGLKKVISKGRNIELLYLSRTYGGIPCVF